MSTVVVFPYYEDNPYQGLISKYAEDEYDFIHLNIRQVVTLFSYLSGLRKCTLIHFHWITNLTQINSCLFAYLITISTTLLMFLNKLLIKTPLVYTVHNRQAHYGKRRSLETFLNKICLKLSDVIIVHADFQKQYVCNSWSVAPNKVTIMRHGSYSDFFSDRRSVGVNYSSDKRPYFLCFGRVEEYKNIDCVVGNINGRDASLMLLGECVNSELENCIRTIADGAGVHLEWHNKKFTYDELYTVSGRCNYVLLPQNVSFTSGTAILALELGLPILCVSNEYCDEILTPDCCVSFENFSQLSNIVSLMKELDELDVRKIDEKRRELSWDKVIVDLKAAYHKALTEKTDEK